MKIFPAIDLYDGKAVRLLRGDYDKMTVYSDNPVEIAHDLEKSGAEYIHMVDLEGARDGTTPNIKTVEQVVRETSLFVEIGGGIRDMKTVRQYLDCGVGRVIIGTAAVTDEEFLDDAAKTCGEKIAVGADVKDGCIAIKGWRESSGIELAAFMDKMQRKGIGTIIVTDISKDGAMKGTNLQMYRDLCRKYDMQLIASGGVSDMEDVRELAAMDIYGAIIGKAYYTGAIDIREAIEVAS